MNPQFLQYDPVRASGLNVGYNAVEQTIGPGETIQYLWHADREYGVCLLRSFGDMRNHRYHGLFGAIIIEPPGAKHYRTFCPVEENYEQQAVIVAPGTDTFREFVLFAHNGIRMLDREGSWFRPHKRVVTKVDMAVWIMRIPGRRGIITALNGSSTD